MKLPEVKGIHKIRDLKICQLWLEGVLTRDQIAERFNLSVTHIGRVVYKHRKVLKVDQGYEKAKRIRWYKVQIRKALGSKKDPADLQDRLRIEIEGDKPLIDNSQHTHYEFKYETIDENKLRITQGANAGLVINREMEGISGGPEVREDAVSSACSDESSTSENKS